MLNIMQPPALQGNEQAQLTQIYRYLFRLSEQLNAAAVSLDTQASKASEAIAKAVGIDPAATAKEGSSFTPLIGLVVKTADIVHAQMDKIVTTLASQYIAQSEWGEYTETISREIEETARKTVDNFIYEAKIESLTPDEEASFDVHLEGFIARGIIGFEEDEDGNPMPIIGIAIGRELLRKKETIDGKTYEMLDTNASMATYTADKLSFWLNGVEVAYMSKAELVITRAYISDSIRLGDWFIEADAINGLSIKQVIERDLDLSQNNTVTVTAEKINAVADKINLKGNSSVEATVKGAVEYYVRLDADDGLHVGKNGAANEVVITPDAVNVRLNGDTYSQLAANYVQFGNYQLRKTSDGGLAFKLSAFKG